MRVHQSKAGCPVDEKDGQDRGSSQNRQHGQGQIGHFHPRSGVMKPVNPISMEDLLSKLARLACRSPASLVYVSAINMIYWIIQKWSTPSNPDIELFFLQIKIVTKCNSPSIWTSRPVVLPKDQLHAPCCQFIIYINKQKNAIYRDHEKRTSSRSQSCRSISRRIIAGGGMPFGNDEVLMFGKVWPIGTISLDSGLETGA